MRQFHTGFSLFARRVPCSASWLEYSQCLVSKGGAQPAIKDSMIMSVIAIIMSVIIILRSVIAIIKSAIMIIISVMMMIIRLSVIMMKISVIKLLGC